MNIMMRKTAWIALQLLTVLGVIVGLVAGCCLLWELTDVYMINGHIYTQPVEEQASVWQHAVAELVDDGFVYGLVAAVALGVSLLTGIAAAVMAFFIKPSSQQ